MALQEGLDGLEIRAAENALRRRDHKGGDGFANKSASSKLDDALTA